jgi:PAS domain S-box-containing protein
MADIFSTLINVRSDVNLVYRLGPDGIMLYHYPEGPESTVGRDFSFREYFQEALTTRNPLASKGRISPTTNQPVATAVMPLWSDTGDFQGLVATNIKLQSLSHALSAIASQYPADEGLQLTIIDHAGQIIAHQDPALLLRRTTNAIPEATEAVLAGETGTRVTGDLLGQEALVSYVPIANVGWGVLVSRPTAVAFAPLREFQRGALIAIGVFLSGGLVFWLILSRRVISPLVRLAGYSQRLGRQPSGVEEGDPPLDDLLERPDQIGYLTRSMQEMHQAIEARLQELSTLLQTSGAVVSSLDPPEVLDRILLQVERLMGVQMCAIFALDQRQGIFRVHASRGLPDWYRQRAIVDPDEPGSVTMQAIRSGRAVQVSDVQTVPAYRDRLERARLAGYSSVMAVPLNTQYTPPAALLVFRPDVHEFSEREIDLLSSFANHAAMAIENANLFARSDMQLEEQTRRLRALIQSMQDGLILEDLDGRVLYANRRITELSGVPVDKAIDARVAWLMDQILNQAQEPEAARQAVDQVLEDGGPSRALFTISEGERPRTIQLRVFQVTDASGTSIGRGRILRDITERHELDRMKSSLISTVSHELRTPLAAIKGYATTLLADDVEWDRDSQRDFLNIISVETDHLNSLVSDLLDMSRIEAGSLNVRKSECDLAELISQAALQAGLLPRQLDVALPADLPPLHADPRRIEVVLRNLLENAVKHGQNGRPGSSPIAVRAEQAAGRLLVRVVDQGPGIPEDQREQVFERFYQATSGLSRSQAGAGLGLAICRGFVRAHGGDIWIEPTQTGASVAFWLPLAKSEPGEVETHE